MKRVFFDLETTGLDVNQHGIHQIAMIIETPNETVELSYHVQPRKGCMVNAEALEIGGVTIDDLRTYEPMDKVFADILHNLGKHCDKFNKTDKFFLCGYNNAGFDNQFLRRFWQDNNDTFYGSWFWPNTLDVFILATQQLLDKRPTMPNFKLHTVAGMFGLAVDESQLHQAIYDLRLTKQIYEQITAPRALEVAA